MRQRQHKKLFIGLFDETADHDVVMIARLEDPKLVAAAVEAAAAQKRKELTLLEGGPVRPVPPRKPRKQQLAVVE